MLATIKTIILDFQEMNLITGVPRHLRIATIAGKAAVCIGVRRSGKSTYLFQVIQGLLQAGVERENILYLNFFDDRLHNLRNGHLGLIADAYYSIYPEKKNTQTVYYFFDEIQMVSNWEPFIDRLMRTEKCIIYITGSSAQMLSREIATQMRGRALSWEIFPFSFREYLDAKDIDPEGRSSQKQFLIKKCFEQFWESGGFPEVISLDSRLRIKIHQEYMHTILFRDIIDRHDLSHPRALTDLSHWLADNIASLYSINGLTGYLKSLGHKVPKSQVANFLIWFEDAFFFFTIRIFDASLARANANPKKIYCVDHALIRSVSSGILVNAGHLLENLVFTALRRISTEIYYYKTKSGREVDFIVRMPDGTRSLFQVCETIQEARTRKRESVALLDAMTETELKTSILITRNETEHIEIKGYAIEVIPIWRMLLDLPET